MIPAVSYGQSWSQWSYAVVLHADSRYVNVKSGRTRGQNEGENSSVLLNICAINIAFYVNIYVYLRICGLYSVGKLERGRGINRADELCLFFFATIWTEMPTCCLG